MDHPQRLKDLKETNCLLNESLHKMDELNEVLAVKHHLDEMIASYQNAVNFSRSQLEKMHHENAQLRFQVRQLKKKAEQRGLNLIDLRAKVERLGHSFTGKSRELKIYVMN